MISDFPSEVKRLEQWQREYKTAQSRLASSIQTHTASVSVNVPSGGSATVWINGNPETMIASCYLTNASGVQLLQVYARPVYDGSRCGYRIWNYLGRAPNPLQVQVKANQEITLSVN